MEDTQPCNDQKTCLVGIRHWPNLTSPMGNLCVVQHTLLSVLRSRMFDFAVYSIR